MFKLSSITSIERGCKYKIYGVFLSTTKNSFCIHILAFVVYKQSIFFQKAIVSYFFNRAKFFFEICQHWRVIAELILRKH